mgnify:CR=1 FL=1
MRRFFLAVFVLGLITWGLPASAQQACFGPSCPGGGTTFSAAVASGPTYCADAGASDAYACNLSPAPASYASIIGVPITVKANTVNTGAGTLDLNGLGAQAIVKVGATTTTALQTNDIRAGSLVTVQWDGSNFECLSCNGNYANLAIANTWTLGQTFSSAITVPNGATGTPSVHGATSNTGIYFDATSIYFGSAGSLKIYVDGTTFTAVGVNSVPSATGNNQTLGTTGLRWAQLWLDATLTAAGTTGAQTINKNLGQVNFAAAATTLVVTDSRATATSFIFTSPLTADTTCKSFAVTRAAGSFTITANAACTAETAVAFLIMAN